MQLRYIKKYFLEKIMKDEDTTQNKSVDDKAELVDEVLSISR